MLASLNEQSGENAKLAFCLYEGDELTGYLLYSLTADEGKILVVFAADDSLADGLIRATLASLSDLGIDKVAFKEPTLAVRLKLIAPGESSLRSIRSKLFSCGGGKCEQCGGCKL